MRYYICPLTLDERSELGPHLRAPDDTVGHLSIEPTRVDRRFVFLATERDLGTSAAFLGSGHWEDIDLTPKMQDTWQTHFGCRPQGAKLSHAVMDAMRRLSDPSGMDFTKPSVPGRNGNIVWQMAGHDPIISRFDYNSSRADSVVHREKLDGIYHQNYLDQHSISPEHARKCASLLCDKLKISRDRESYIRLVHPDLRDEDLGWIEPDSEINETWPTLGTDIATGQDNAWTETVGDCTVKNPGKRFSEVGQNGACEARCDVVLSSVDQLARAQSFDVDNASDQHRLHVRYASGAVTSYFVFRTPSVMGVFKQTAGSGSGIGTNLTGLSSPADTTTLAIQIDGDLIKTFEGGVEKQSFTDATHSGGTQVGLGVNFGGESDIFFAEDLAVAAAGRFNLVDGGLLATSLVDGGLVE